MESGNFQTSDRNEGQETLVRCANRSDGVGNALRAAFRGRLKQTPPELAELLEKLD